MIFWLNSVLFWNMTLEFIITNAVCDSALMAYQMVYQALIFEEACKQNEFGFALLFTIQCYAEFF